MPVETVNLFLLVKVSQATGNAPTGGVVSLDGSVDTVEQLWHAAQAIRKVPGVKAVVTSGVTVKEDVSA